MALQDQNLVFSSGQNVTTTAVSTNTYDILQGLTIASNAGAGAYPVPPTSIIGNASFFGEDLGGGRGMGTPTVEVYNVSTTAASGGTSLQVQLQGAPDNGGGSITGLTFTPYIMSQVIPIASLLAPRLVAAFDFPKRSPDNAGLPRFINLNYVCVGTFANLSINSYINLGYTQAQSTLGQYPANY